MEIAKLKRIAVIISMSLSVSLSLVNVAYAFDELMTEDAPNVYLIDGDSNNINEDEIFTWVQEENKWKYINQYGEPRYGLFADEYGDIYYGNYTGYIYQNRLDEKGQYFGSDGRLVNLGAYLINNEEATKNADILDSGEALIVDNTYDIDGFLEYYLGQEYIYLQPAVVIRDKRLEGKTRIQLYNTPSYNREDIEKVIDELYNNELLKGNTIDDKILLGALQLRKNTSYDASYVTTDILTCIKDKKACCRQYASMFSYVLNKNGIHAEEVSGFTTMSHSWVRAYYDNRWHYIDISAYIETLNPFFLDIDYQYYMDNYTTKSRILTSPLK